MVLGGRLEVGNLKKVKIEQKVKEGETEWNPASVNHWLLKYFQSTRACGSRGEIHGKDVTVL